MLPWCPPEGLGSAGLQFTLNRLGLHSSLLPLLIPPLYFRASPWSVWDWVTSQSLKLVTVFISAFFFIYGFKLSYHLSVPSNHLTSMADSFSVLQRISLSLVFVFCVWYSSSWELFGRAEMTDMAWAQTDHPQLCFQEGGTIFLFPGPNGWGSWISRG